MSKAKIFKSSPKGVVRIPSSKSDAHRKIICASLCVNQTSVISNVDFSNDINATIEAMKYFADIVIDEDKLIITGREIKENEALFNAYESGSTLRFLIPLFSFFFEKTKVIGSKRLLSRPLDIYHDIYQKDLVKEEASLIIFKHSLNNYYQIKGNISSQFISGLLFVLPLLKEDTTIEIVKEYESKSYVNLTIEVLKLFGIEIKEIDNKYLIKGNQKYKATNTQVEGDYSQLAFFGVLGVINSKIKVVNINKDSIQGDRNIIKFIKEFNGNVEETSNGYIFSKSDLIGTTVDIKDNPDLGPILFVLGALSKGKTTILNTRRLRIKESDRIESMKNELKKYHVDLIDYENHVEIYSSQIETPNEEVSSCNDHRILMSLSILSTLVEETTFSNVEAVNKSYPNFYQDLFNLGIEGEVYETK